MNFYTKNNTGNEQKTTSWPRKSLMIMRCIVLFWLLGTLQVMANLSYSQSVRLSFEMKDATVREILSVIEQKSDFYFTYNSTQIEAARKISVKVKNRLITDVLDEMFAGQNVNYTINDKHIVLYKANTPPSDAVTTPQLTKHITGKVSDLQGEPIIGANVVEKANPANGTITDVEGKFALDVAEKAILVVSFIGYHTREIAINSQSVFHITLSEDMQTLEEVVVVGYGTQKKVNLTGAVSSVSLAEMDKRTVAQTSLALQGLVPGLTVMQRSGKPGNDGGTIRLRGNTTIGNNDPLVLIDGVESSINSINPESIESISILKDAASSAIYGNRAANGVILITTKRAEKGKVYVSYNGYVAKGTPTNVPKYVGAVDFMKYISIAKRAVGMTPEYTEEYIKEYEAGVAKKDPNYPDVDWFDATATNNGLMTSHIITVSLGTPLLRSLTQAGYLSQNGITENTNFKRYSLRSNNDYQISPKFTLSSDISLLYAETDEPSKLSSGFNFVGRIPANQAAYLADGRYGPGWSGINPVAYYKDGGVISRTDPSAIMNFSTLLKPWENLELQAQYALNYWEDHTKDWDKRVQLYLNDGTPDPQSQSKSTLTEITGRSLRNLLSGRATYTQTLFNDHHIKLMAGYQQETFWNKWHSGYREVFPFPDYPVLNAGGAENQKSRGSASDYALQAFFGRINYDFKGKYLFEANLRYDGSSRFAEGYRWGVFPSVSGGWRISEERFWDHLKDIAPNVKLRASWGQLGNQNTLNGFYPAQSIVGLGTNYVFDKNIVSGASITTMANSQISWETTTMSNIAVEFNLLKKLDITAEYYYRETKDILLTLDIPLIIGLSAPSQNAGRLENKGWEIDATYKDHWGDFHFRAALNLSDVKNKILDLKGINETWLTVNREGYPMGSIYGYEAVGYIVPEDYDAAGKYKGATQMGNFGPGDIKYKDQLTVDTNNDGIPDEADGVINTSDLVILGSTIPRYTFGLNLYGEYKGFDLNMMFQGVGKADGYVWGHSIGSFYEGGSMPEIGKDYWTPENRNAQFPRLAFNNSNNQQNSSFWLKDASYLRLKNIQVGYTIPKPYSSKIGISNLRLYISTDNVFTMSKFWKYFDVESPILHGYGSFYPIMRTTTFGIDVTF